MAVFLIIACVYPPEPIVAGRMCQDLARHLAGEGHNVTVVCPFPSRPIGVKHPGYARRDNIDQRIEDGVTVARVPSFTCPTSNFKGRFRESLSFGRAAVYFLRNQPTTPDAIFDMSWPMVGQDLVSRAAWRLGIPLVLNVQDIYPESLLKRLPAWIARIAGTALKKWDRKIALRARKLVIISENMRKTYLLDRQIPGHRIALVNLWQDESLFTVLPQREEAAAKYGVDSSMFTFMYLGNIGPVAGVESIIRAFQRAKLCQAQLLIGGEGSLKPACVQIVQENQLRNVHFLTDPNFRNVPCLQSLADVFLLPTRRNAAMSSVPSKMISYLFSGKPVLATVDSASDTARCIREAKCGWVREPENESWLAKTMVEAAALPQDVLRKMGSDGRAYGLRHFSKTQGVKELGRVVLEAAGGTVAG